MTNLKTELNTLVREYEIRSGLINDLAKQATVNLADACRTAAARGKHSVKHVPITFSGCKGGYSFHMKDVLSQVRVFLDENQMSCVMHITAANECYADMSW